MELNPIQAEISRIEARAARKTELLLAKQEEYLQAQRLVDVIKLHHPNPESGNKLEVSPFYSSLYVEFMINAFHADAEGCCQALAAAGIAVERVGESFNPEKYKRWHLVGWPEVEVYFPLGMEPLLVAEQPMLEPA